MRWNRPAADLQRSRSKTIARRPARSVRRARARAGLSLFEVLVAIGILVALAAVSLPWAWSRLAARDLPESAETITAILMLARAEAMATGRLVEVRVRRGEGSLADPSIEGRTLELRSTYLDPDRLSFEEGSGTDLDEAFGFAGSGSDDAGPTAPIGASWSLRRLPPGIGLRPIEAESRREFDSPEFDAAAEFAGTDLVEALDRGPEAIATGPIDRAIAIFLPDGSNILAAAWWLEEVPADGVLPDPEDDDRRRMRLSLGDPSGVPRWSEIERIVPRGVGIEPPASSESSREDREARPEPNADSGRASRDEARREPPRAARQAPASRPSSGDSSSRGDDEPSREPEPDDEDEEAAP